MNPLHTGGRWGVLAGSLGLSAAAGYAAFALAKKRWSGRRLAAALDGQANGNGLFASAHETAEAPPEADALRQSFRELLQSRAAARMAELDPRPLVGRPRLAAPA